MTMGFVKLELKRESALPLRSQPVSATNALNLSAGVSNSNVLRDRSISCHATFIGHRMGVQILPPGRQPGPYQVQAISFSLRHPFGYGSDF